MALIERTEREARVMRGPVIVVNDWQEPQAGWQARMSYENNESRKAAMRASDQEAPTFHWVRGAGAQPIDAARRGDVGGGRGRTRGARL